MHWVCLHLQVPIEPLHAAVCWHPLCTAPAALAVPEVVEKQSCWHAAPAALAVSEVVEKKSCWSAVPAAPAALVLLKAQLAAAPAVSSCTAPGQLHLLLVRAAEMAWHPAPESYERWWTGEYNFRCVGTNHCTLVMPCVVQLVSMFVNTSIQHLVASTPGLLLRPHTDAQILLTP